MDDIRYPVHDTDILVRTPDEAIAYVKEHGIPQHISLDHDLGVINGEKLYAMTFVDWLIEYLLDTNQKLPPGFTFSVHSDNPPGAENLAGTMNNIVKHFGH